MLKRYQVLLNDWLADYIKLYTEKIDWSFSETIRLILCVEIISWASVNYPKFKTKISNKTLAKKLKTYLRSPDSLEEKFHREISKIYFEARKAAEFILSQEKKNKHS